jgi:perosamine synthetase
MSELSDLQVCAGAVMIPGLSQLNEIRSENGRALCERISGDDRYHVSGYSPGKCPIYLRLPVLAKNMQKRDEIIARLQKAGIKSSIMYPSTIREIKGVEKYLANPDDDYSGAQEVVDRLFTLPTHPYVREDDIDRIVDCLTKSENLIK